MTNFITIIKPEKKNKRKWNQILKQTLLGNKYNNNKKGVLWNFDRNLSLSSKFMSSKKKKNEEKKEKELNYLSRPFF